MRRRTSCCLLHGVAQHVCYDGVTAVVRNFVLQTLGGLTEQGIEQERSPTTMRVQRTPYCLVCTQHNGTKDTSQHLRPAAKRLSESSYESIRKHHSYTESVSQTNSTTKTHNLVRVRQLIHFAFDDVLSGDENVSQSSLVLLSHTFPQRFCQRGHRVSNVVANMHADNMQSATQGWHLQRACSSQLGTRRHPHCCQSTAQDWNDKCTRATHCPNNPW